MSSRRHAGFSIIELTVSLAISALLFASLYPLVNQTFAAQDQADAANTKIAEIQFALDRMVRNVSETRLMQVPQDATPRDVFAVVLPASVDRDGDGFADADNDRDGRIDEDPGVDMNNDGVPGIREVDDDGDGSADEDPILWQDNDERGGINEDWLNNVDDDGDGLIDEDWPADQNNDAQPGISGTDDDGDTQIDEGLLNDDDEDGAVDEDWLDAVVFYLSGSTIVERLPVPWDATSNGDVDGNDYHEQVVLDGVTSFEVVRTPGANADLLAITISADDARGEPQSLSTIVRVGGAL